MERHRYNLIALWVVRLLLIVTLLVDGFVVANVVGRFAMSGASGVVGYYEHIALTGVDVVRTPQAELRRMVWDSTIRILWGYALLAGFTVALFWGHSKLKRRRSAPLGASPRADLNPEPGR
jgi:hypothetical protein